MTAGTDDYNALLEKLDNVLSDYTLSTSDSKIVQLGEKRIYAPNYVYFKDGNAVILVSGYSSKQKDSREELAKEILDDEEKIFNFFLKN